MSGSGGGGLGLTLQQRGTESFLFPCSRMMMMVRHNHDRAFEGGGGGGGGGGDGHGPTGSGGAEEVVRCMSDIYDVAGGSGSGGAVGVRTSLQPFDISSATTTTPTHTSFKSPGALFLFFSFHLGGSMTRFTKSIITSCSLITINLYFSLWKIKSFFVGDNP